MLEFLSRSFARPPEEKASAARQLIALNMQGQAAWTPRNYLALAQEGFARNAIVYRCVRMIAEAAASVRMHAKSRKINDLLLRPNVDQDYAELLEAHFGYLLLSGNGYIEAAILDGQPRELYALRPDRMKVIPRGGGAPGGWEYSAGGRKIRFVRDAHTDQSPILHMRLFNPANDYYGQSPLEAAAFAVDIHNAGAKWNKALLDNAARPSGALVLSASSSERLSDEQFERLKAELADVHQGAQNAGRPMLLEGGLDWKPMSHAPADMEFLQSRHAAAREIALAFGVPPMLLGIPGDNTYANYREANLAFWRQTVLPLVRKTARSFESWLSSWMGGDVSIQVDEDNIPALCEDVGARWERLSKADFLSDAEKRALAGLFPQGTKET
ncbi:MAG: phage portal protein [Robiginitomaculum sp.]|nr:phage portal protein [Robiginitomaculum sp.]MDQ7077316.1 phage portal protein [Robiginitomaculum sp.]